MEQTARDEGEPTLCDRVLAHLPLLCFQQRSAGKVARYDAGQHKGRIMGSLEDTETCKLMLMGIVAYGIIPSAVVVTGLYIYNDIIR